MNRRSRDLILAAWMMTCWVGSALAADTVTIGDRVRIHAPALTGAMDPAVLHDEKMSPFTSRQVLVGKVTGLGRDTLNLQVGDEDISVPVDAVERMDLWFRGHQGVAFAIIGIVGGAVIGGAIGSSMEEAPATCRPGEVICGDLEFSKTAKGVVLGLLLGGAVGHAIGRTVSRDHWKAVDVRSLTANVALDRAGNASLVCVLRF